MKYNKIIMVKPEYAFDNVLLCLKYGFSEGKNQVNQTVYRTISKATVNNIWYSTELVVVR